MSTLTHSNCKETFCFLIVNWEDLVLQGHNSSLKEVRVGIKTGT